jgi:hypothetical protein
VVKRLPPFELRSGDRQELQRRVLGIDVAEDDATAEAAVDSAVDTCLYGCVPRSTA